MTHPSCKKVLITGASGFLGTEIVAAARESGWSVRAFDRTLANFPRDVEIVTGDLADEDLISGACSGVSAVIHAAGLAHVFGRAAKDVEQFTAINEQRTARLIKSAVKAGISNVVLVSSVSVYGGYTGETCNEDQPCNPIGPYAVSKWKAEQQAIQHMSGSDASLSILRFATIYGEGDRGNVARLIRSLQSGQFLWLGLGLNQKSLIYKRDAARACIIALESSKPGIHTFNVSSSPTSMREIVSAICGAINRPTPRLAIPQPLLTALGAFQLLLGDPFQLGSRIAKFMRNDVYDASRFNSAFQFQPSTSLAEGLCREVEYLRKRDEMFVSQMRVQSPESSAISGKRVRP
ncbi:MAG: NAD(P)-dependent oxidoreductase [Acidobacteria bacterium]|nr:NAD(P)-dependent oxidoreductase [Acidobacteriota bacterium]